MILRQNDLDEAQITALCKSISHKELPNSAEQAVDYYLTLSDRERFGRPHSSRERVEQEVNTLKDWLWIFQDAVMYYPTMRTRFVHSLLLRAGGARWCDWAGILLSPVEFAAILQVCGIESGKLSELLSAACQDEQYSQVKAGLMAYLFLDNGASVTALYSAVAQNKSNLRSLSIEALSDFDLPLSHPASVPFCERLAKLYADCETLNVFAHFPVSTLTKGKLFTWAKILHLYGNCGASDQRQQTDYFVDSYLAWISDALEYTVQTDIKGALHPNESEFLECLSHIFPSEGEKLEELQKLWLKKAHIYHGWQVEDVPYNNHWFQHIGLLLWKIGVIRRKNDGNDTLIIAVMKTLNDYIPMCLIESEYKFLLYHIFCLPQDNDPQMNKYLFLLLKKVYSMPLMIDIALAYLTHPSTEKEMLTAMFNRLKLLSTLPKNTKHSKNQGQIISTILADLESSIAEI